MEHSIIHWIDYLIIIISVVAVVGIGIYFARRQKTTDTYYKAGGRIPAWAIGLSIFATLISSVTFIAYPGAAYAGNWILLVQGLMVPIVLVAMIGIIVPLFRRVIKLSTYEYFERRFGFFARMYGSIAFALTHFSKMGTVFYLVALATSAFMGIDVFTIILVLGVAITFITFLGGMEAVIWMDVFQGLMMIGGGLICAVILIFAPEGGPASFFASAKEFHKIGFGPYEWDLTKLTFIVMVLNGIFYAIQKYGTDQTIVQRYLTAKTDKAAKRASFIGVGLSVPIWALFMLIGTGLYVFYHQAGGPVPPEGIRADAIFPYFIGSELPVGIVGIIIAALLAAAISTLAADMNCLSAIGVQDFYARFKPKSTDRQRLRLGRWIVLATGAGAVGIALLYNNWGGEGVLGVVFELYAIFSAGIVGLFLLGLFSRRANKQGLAIGIVAAILFTAWAMLTSTKVNDKLILDLGFNYTHHKYMLGVYSHVVLFVVAWIASFFFKSGLAPDELTVYGYLKERKEVKQTK
ncbi:MAG: sodium:solute symporter [Rikenellaceae bacterium]|jgi:SSS family solute:Na+ symporter|nr:sodium:solute symporter [Rikenellaceae bacterium]